MANLIAPRYIAPDPQKTWLAAEQERASRDRTSLARQAETSRSVEAQQRLAQSGAQTAMNLQTQMQNMAIKADMHPLQMIEAQKRNQNLSLSNQAAAQQLILNEDKDELDQLQGIASLSASRTQTEINKRNLEEKIRQDGEAPDLNRIISEFSRLAGDENSTQADVDAVDVSTITGEGLNLVQRARQATRTAVETRKREGLAFKIQQQVDADKLFLMSEGHLDQQDVNDPAKVKASATSYTASVVAGLASLPAASKVNQADFTPASGIIDEIAYGNAVRRQVAIESGATFYQQTDTEGKVTNVYVSPQGSRGDDRGMTASQRETAIQKLTEQFKLDDPSLSFQEARDKATEEVGGNINKDSFPEATGAEIHAIANFAFAALQEPGSTVDTHGSGDTAYLDHDTALAWGEDAEKAAEGYFAKATEGTLKVNREETLKFSLDPDEFEHGKVYWKKDKYGLMQIMQAEHTYETVAGLNNAPPTQEKTVSWRSLYSAKSANTHANKKKND